MKVFAATLLSALMLHLSLGLANAWVLAWFAATPLLWLAYGKTPLLHVALASLAAFACGQIYMFQCYGDVLPLPVLGLFVALLGILFVGAVLLSRATAARGWTWAALLAFPASWTACEYLFGTVSPHGTYAALGYAEVSFPAGMQVAAFFGVHAVTFLLCLGANAVALVLRGWQRPGMAGVAICAVALLLGAARLALPPQASVRVAALADADSWRQANHEHTAAAAQRAAEAYAQTITRMPGVRVVVIPEGALSVPQVGEQTVLGALADVARQSGAVVVAGTLVPGPVPNRAFSFMPDGSRQIYAKRHLLIPLEPGTPGTEPGVLGQGYAVQICKDMDFPVTVRESAAHGIRLMVVPANDFGRDGWLHARMAIMRGVENGFAVLRSAFNGIETISDANGRVLAVAPTQQAGMVVIAANVPLGPGPTLYTRFGDVFSWLCIVLTAFIGARLLSAAAARPRGRCGEERRLKALESGRPGHLHS